MSKFVDEFSVYVGNLDFRVPLADLEELIYELFLQAGPVDKVYFPSDAKTGWHKCYGFVAFEHKESVPYSIQLLSGIQFFGRPLKVTLKVKPARNPNDSIAAVADATGDLRSAISTPTGNITTPDSARQFVSNGMTTASSLNEAQHPTLGQRLSPPPPLMSVQNKPLHPTLGQTLSPRPLFGSEHVPKHAVNGGSMLPPPPNLFFPPPSTDARNRIASRVPLPPLPPLFPPLLPPPITEDHSMNGNSSYLPPPLLPPPRLMDNSRNDDYPRHEHSRNDATCIDDMPPLLLPRPSFAEDDSAIDPRHVFPDHTHSKLHKSRGVHINDKPSWVTQETRKQIRDYHLKRLEKTLALYQQQFLNDEV